MEFIHPQLQSGGEHRIFGGKEVAMKLRVVLEPSDEGGYTAYVPALPGCISEGDTREEALANIREAIELYIEPVEDDINYTPDSEVIEIAV
jgi:predicted RNase H-like HicB family nuclease